MKAKYLPKKINENLSLKYYIKNQNEYETRECHRNTYNTFYDKNYDEMDQNNSKFELVTGLLAFQEKKRCIIHSWIEKNGQVIDVTIFQNTFSNEIITENDEKCLAFLESTKEIKYFPYFKISNENFSQICNNLRTIEKIQEYLNNIIASVKKDTKYIKQVEDEYGYMFYEDSKVDVLNKKGE